MTEYKISFELLLPRNRILRLDVIPFAFVYSLLIYLLVQFWEDDNYNLYVRLAMIAAGFLNCLTYIFGYWSKRMQALIQYRRVAGDILSNLENASHVFISEKKQGYTIVYGITDFYKEQNEGERPFYFFHFQQRKFYYNYEKRTFTRLTPSLQNFSFQDIFRKNIVLKEKRQYYDNNILEISIRPFWSIFRDQIIDPFAFFQLFSVFLWMMDENMFSSFLILAMLLGSAYTISVQRIKTLVGYRSMTLAPHEVYVFENQKWELKSSYDLLPGDVIAVTPGYQHKKSAFDMITDAEYTAQAIPFGSKILAKPMSQIQKQQNSSFRNVSCDILIIGGSCIANQSILTGQAIPQIKEPIQSYQLAKKFHEFDFKTNIVFCGTQILQINDSYNERELNQLLSSTNAEFNIPKPPINNCCIGMVLKTGYDTTKGKLIRKVIANAQSLNIEQKDGLWIILFLLICSIITSIYVLQQGMQNQKRSKQKLFLRCILILTTVVPPQLPMILNLAVNNSILFLQKKKIFVSQPKKIPLGGKVNVIAFDKTGTLTEDKFIFQGIVDDCKSFLNLKSLKNCSAQNHIVLAGCHSLISVERQLTGDPIQLMLFELTDWTYTSKGKQARRILEKVTIDQVFPFKSQLKRMSTVVVHVSESGVRKLKVLVKGAPQAVEQLLALVPQGYKQAYSHYTKQGYRLLAMASKETDYSQFKKYNGNREQQRKFAESQLTFSGFFICNSPLKADTLKNIESLQKAAYKILIITGDNILTANKVGLTLKFGIQAWNLQKQGDGIFLEDHEGVKHQIHNLKQIQNKAKTPNIFISTSTAKELPHQYYQFVTIFARTSPYDKEVIVKTFKQMKNCGILYAGDGTNDVRGLRVADVGVAVVGTTGMSEVEKKQEEQKKQDKLLDKKIQDLQRDVSLPFKKKLQMMGKLSQEKMKRKTVSFDDQIKVGDACIAAPFTSKHSNSIKCVLIIIRQSVATLVTTIQTYKILAISSILQAYSLAEMNLTNLKYSQTQTLTLGVLASINFYYFSNAKPLKKISHIRAPNTIFNIWFAISFFSQIFIFTYANYYALNKIGLAYVLEEDKNLSADKQFQKSFLNTVIFLFSAISQSAVFIINHGGEPHMESLIKNSRYFKFLVIPLVVCFVLTSNIFPQFSSTVDLKFEGIPDSAIYQMLTVFGLLVASTYTIDRFCRFAQYREFVGWF